MTDEQTGVRDKRTDMMDKVAKLLAKAENSSFEEEAQSFREKAETLMAVYAIEQFEIDQRRRPEERTKPESRHFVVAEEGSPIADLLVDLFGTLVEHVGGRAVYYGLRSKVGTQRISVQVVAYPVDLDYIEMMFNNLRLFILANMTPKYDDLLSFEENLVRCKEAGMKWEDAHRVLQPGVPWERRHGVRYTKVYTDYCKFHGKDRMYTAPLVFQRNFTEGFIARISIRLREVREHQRTEGVGEHSGSGMELMLRSNKAVVDQLFNELHPNLRLADYRKKTKYDGAAQGAGSQAARNADLGQKRAGSRKEIG